MRGEIPLIVVGVLIFCGQIFALNEDNVRLRKRRGPANNASVEVSVFRKPPSYEPSRRSPHETEQIEYRLTRLEVQVAEKSENLRSELREGNRRLQALEWQSAEVQTALEGFRSELGRFTEASQPAMTRVFGANPSTQTGLGKLEARIDSLATKMQLAITTLRAIYGDMAVIRKNITTIANVTRSLMLGHEDLVTKPFLSNSLFDVKHHQVYQTPVPELSCERQKLPKNCREIKESGVNVSGIYRIQPQETSKPFMVLCDMNTVGGGWTYIHNRFEGSQDFYLDWNSYKHGFGNLGGEFWLGLENIHQLTGFEVNELLVELVDMNLEKARAHYGAFSVGSEVEGFALKILGGYSGDAGDSLIDHAGSKFSTKDMDQDGWADGSCAKSHEGAWWYRSCDTSNLNGKYLSGSLPEDFTFRGMYWGEFRGPQYSLKQARMMVRPRDESSPPIFPDGIAPERR